MPFSRPPLQFEAESRHGVQHRGREELVGVVGRQWRVLIPAKLKLLQNSGEKNVKLFFRQTLSEARALPDSERNNPIAGTKPPVLQKSFRIEPVRIRKVFRVVHDVVEAAKDQGLLWDDEVSNRDVLGAVVRHSGPEE